MDEWPNPPGPYESHLIGLFSLVDLDIKCCFCGDIVKPPYPSDKAIERFKRAVGYAVEGVPCQPCMSLRRAPLKAQARALTAHDAQDAVKLAQTAVRNNDYETYSEAITQINSLIFGIEKKIENSIDEIRAYNARREEIISHRDGLIRKMQASPNASYFERRVQADRFIAKPEVRTEVFKKANYKCVKCSSRESLTVDHIFPVKLGGKDEMDNLQCLCRRCNSSKGCKPESKTVNTNVNIKF